MTKSLITSFDGFYVHIKEILEDARNKVYRTANQEMLQAYWNVGREIVEEEQKGKDRAEYGNYLIKNLSAKLTHEFGKGFTISNLKYMRQFYIEQAITGNWSTRQLERQINSLYFERILWSKNHSNKNFNVEVESKPKKMHLSHFIKDPFVLEFLDLKENEKLAETSLESALIEKLQQFLLEPEPLTSINL